MQHALVGRFGTFCPIKFWNISDSTTLMIVSVSSFSYRIISSCWNIAQFHHLQYERNEVVKHFYFCAILVCNLYLFKPGAVEIHIAATRVLYHNSVLFITEPTASSSIVEKKWYHDTVNGRSTNTFLRTPKRTILFIYYTIWHNLWFVTKTSFVDKIFIFNYFFLFSPVDKCTC